MKRITLATLFTITVAAAPVAVAQDPTPPPRPATPAAPMPAPRRAMAPMAPIAPQWVDDVSRSAAEAARSAIDAARFNFDWAGMSFGRAADALYGSPPAAWAQGDPADSVYRVARDALNRGDYGRAARLFANITQTFPKSAYQTEAQYYEAYARYKIGTTEELRAAAKLLEPLATRTPQPTTSRSYRVDSSRRSAGDSEVASLYARINGVLAQRGDRDAAAKVAQAAAHTGASSCDREEVQVRVEALNALSQMDPPSALPMLRRVLDSKDECSSELRQRAVFMLGRRGDADAATLLIGTAKSDPAASVRTEAINWLPRLQGDVGVTALEDLLRTEQDERIQRAVVRALVSSDNQRARSSMRALIDRKDAPLNLRVEAISSYNSEHATTEDAAYLRQLFTRADDDRIKEAVVSALSRMGGPENDQWVVGLARNSNESSQVRAMALSRLSRSNIPVSELAKLYDDADSFNVRQQVINILSSRKEPEATDKLIDIVKNSTVISLRTQAINALARKKDPRTTQLLMDLLDKKP